MSIVRLGHTTVVAAPTPPTITISGDATVIAGTPYTLHLQAAYPTSATNPSSIQSWSIDWGDGTIQNPDAQLVYGNPSTVEHRFPTTGGTFSITAKATDANGTYAASGGDAVTISVTGGSAANDALSIAGPDSATVGSAVELKASGGRVSGGSSAITYIWRVTSSNQTVATGNGPVYSFTPLASGSFVATVTAIGDPAGPSVASHVLAVPLAEGQTLPISGPDVLLVGHISVFNFSRKTIYDFFGRDQVLAWEREAERSAPGGAGPTFQWKVTDANGTNVTPPGAGGPFIARPMNLAPPTTLAFSAPEPGIYTVTLSVTYNGKTYFRNARTLQAITPNLVNVIGAVVPKTDSIFQEGTQAFENPDGSILLVSEIVDNNGGAHFDPAIRLTKFSATLSLDRSFGNQGVVTTRLSGFYDFQNYPNQWYGKGFRAALQSDGKFVVCGTVVDTTNGKSDVKNAYDNYGNDPSFIDYPSVWIARRYNANGTTDTSFGTGGQFTEETSRLNYLQTIAIQDDGKILLGGSGFMPNSSGILLNTSNGSLPDGPIERPAFLVSTPQCQRHVRHVVRNWRERVYPRVR